MAAEPKTTEDDGKDKKLSSLETDSIPIDQCAFSLKRKNVLRINLNRQMESFYLSHTAIV